MRKRRELITLIGGAAAWPLAARGQQSSGRRIGVLTNLSENDPEGQIRLAAFLQGLQELGWTVGRNVRIDFRWAAGDIDRNRRNAAELVALAPDVILAAGSFGVGQLQQVTRTVPIVFVNVIDPVGGGFVESLARPGGNATGFANFEYGISGKWLELLKQIAPHVTRVAVLRESLQSLRERTAWRSPKRGAVVWCGVEPDRPPRRRGDRARHQCLRARVEW